MVAESDDELIREDDESDRPTDDEVRAALRALRTGDDATLGEVLMLCFANDDYAIQLIPQPAIDAVFAKYEIEGDIANGGMDQVAWNHGSDQTREFATVFRVIGAVENADLLDRLATALDEYHTAVSSEEISADPVTHFLSFRRSVEGPFFGVPELEQELAETLLEFVIERADDLPNPDAPLPAANQ